MCSGGGKSRRTPRREDIWRRGGNLSRWENPLCRFVGENWMDRTKNREGWQKGERAFSFRALRGGGGGKRQKADVHFVRPSGCTRCRGEEENDRSCSHKSSLSSSSSSSDSSSGSSTCTSSSATSSSSPSPKPETFPSRRGERSQKCEDKVVLKRDDLRSRSPMIPRGGEKRGNNHPCKHPSRALSAAKAWHPDIALAQATLDRPLASLLSNGGTAAARATARAAKRRRGEKRGSQKKASQRRRHRRSSLRALPPRRRGRQMQREPEPDWDEGVEKEAAAAAAAAPAHTVLQLPTQMVTDSEGEKWEKVASSAASSEQRPKSKRGSVTRRTHRGCEREGRDAGRSSQSQAQRKRRASKAHLEASFDVGTSGQGGEAEGSQGRVSRKSSRSTTKAGGKAARTDVSAAAAAAADSKGNSPSILQWQRRQDCRKHHG